MTANNGIKSPVVFLGIGNVLILSFEATPPTGNVYLRASQDGDVLYSDLVPFEWIEDMPNGDVMYEINLSNLFKVDRRKKCLIQLGLEEHKVLGTTVLVEVNTSAIDPRVPTPTPAPIPAPVPASVPSMPTAPVAAAPAATPVAPPATTPAAAPFAPVAATPTSPVADPVIGFAPTPTNWIIDTAQAPVTPPTPPVPSAPAASTVPTPAPTVATTEEEEEGKGRGLGIKIVLCIIAVMVIALFGWPRKTPERPQITQVQPRRQAYAIEDAPLARSTPQSPFSVPTRQAQVEKDWTANVVPDFTTNLVSFKPVGPMKVYVAIPAHKKMQVVKPSKCYVDPAIWAKEYEYRYAHNFGTIEQPVWVDSATTTALRKANSDSPATTSYLFENMSDSARVIEFQITPE